MFDVLIAGGGMVGAALAVALAEQGKSVACVDPISLQKAIDSEDSNSFDQRATACSMTTVNFFSNLGLWSGIRDSAAAIHQIDVSKQSQWGRTRLTAAELDLDAFGYVVPNKAIATALAKAFGEIDASRLTTYWGQCVANCQQQNGFAAITLDNGETLATKLLVVADGGRSQLREQLRISSRSYATAQTAVVCNVRMEKQGAACAFERFTHAGPLALLPLGANYYNLVWCASASENQARMELTDSEFAAALNQAFGVRLGQVQEVGKRGCFPLDIVAAEQLVAGRVVVLGNAAQALHPVAGQGFNLGIRDAANLVEVLAGIDDCGELLALERYARSRKQDRNEMLAFTTQLATATAVPTSGVVSASFGLGLAGFGQWGAARKRLAMRASGFQKNLPVLCQ